MRAINLVPADERRGQGSGIGAYALLGVLAVALIVMTLFVLESNKITDKRAELAVAKSRTASMQGRIDALKPYVAFADLERSRVQTVRSLAASRFDWEQVMHDLAHVTTKQVWLQSMTGTVAPGITVEGGSGASNSFRALLPNPALEIEGCATSNKAVVGFIARLRAMKGVQRVTLSDSTKTDNATPVQASTGPAVPGGAPGAGATAGCSTSDAWPDFHVVVFYAPVPAAATPAPATTSTSTTSTTSTTAPAPTPASPAPAGSAPTPASSGAHP